MSMRSLFAGLAAAGVVLASLLPASAAPPGDASAALINKVYPVADLIIPPAGSFTTAPGKTQEECLIRLIAATISPQSWAQMGGPGSIDYFPVSMALVVRQTPDVHEHLDDLLSALRRLQDVEVAVELRFLTVSDECLAKLGVAETTESETRLLDDTQVRLLLETVQNDPRSQHPPGPENDRLQRPEGAAGSIRTIVFRHWRRVRGRRATAKSRIRSRRT